MSTIITTQRELITGGTQSIVAKLVTGSKTFKNSTTTTTTLKKKLTNTNSIKAAAFSRPSPEVLPQQQIKEVDTTGVLTLLDKNESTIKRAGNFLLGPTIGSSPVKCIQQFLARRDGTDDFCVLKILTLKDIEEKETTDDIQGKTLLLTEHSLLSLVKNEEGVIHEHGIFRETVQERVLNARKEVVYKDVRRLCLVLDCYVAHDFTPKSSNLTNMQCYVIREKKLPESVAIRIFCKVVQIVERLHKIIFVNPHQLNIVHRDLKLGNIILNKDSHEVTLANFCLGKHLSSDNDLLNDQRGSPAYMSPDIVTGKPYLGKPSDMWALGVLVYTMLYGQFPFYDQSPTELFRKIKKGEFQIPVDVNVSQKTVELINSLLVLDPKKRSTASQALQKVRNIISAEQSLMSDSDLQVVPNCHPGAERPKKRSYPEAKSIPFNIAADIASIFEKCEEPSINEDLEPQSKKVKLDGSSNFPELISQYTLDEKQLKRIHAIYVAQKITLAASLGKLSAQMITEELASRLSSSSSNCLINSAATNTDAIVPDYKNNFADMIKKTARVGGLKGRVAV